MPPGRAGTPASGVAIAMDTLCYRDWAKLARITAHEIAREFGANVKIVAVGGGSVIDVTYEYGNAFLIVAGLLNMLVVLDGNGFVVVQPYHDPNRISLSADPLKELRTLFTG